MIEPLPKLLMMLADEDGAQAACAAAGRAGGAIAVGLWKALPRSVLGTSSHAAAGPGAVTPTFAVEIEARRADGGVALVDAMPRLGAGLIFGGHDHVIMPGTGDIALFGLLFRKPDMDGGAFNDYWLNRHADFGRRNPAGRYRQLHRDRALTLAAAAATGLQAAPFDGVAEVYHPDLPSLQRRLAAPAVAAEAFEDEKRFIDHARSVFLPFERLI